MAGAAAGLLLCLLGHLVPLQGFRPNCTTDYATELTCRWSAGAATSCSREVRLRYARASSPCRADGPLLSLCVPEDERGPASTPQCSCRIPGTDFRRACFSLALEVNGARTGQVARVQAEKQVKPKRPANLTADTGRSHSVVLAWQWDAVYTPDQKEDLLLGSPTYEVAYWPVGHREKGFAAETKEQSYEVFLGRLSPGPHSASVRLKVLHFGGLWSGWSAPCRFHVDSGDRLWLLVLWLCPVVMAAVLASYFCFARLKRSCWDRIPNPARSKVIGDVAAQPLSALRKTQAVGEGKAPPDDRWERDYENCPGALWPGTAPHTAKGELLGHGSSGWRLQSFLTPEATLVESPLTICSRGSARKAEGPEWQAPADAAPPHQEAVASLFLQILDCDFRSAEEDPGGLKPDQGPEPPGSALFRLPETSLGSGAAGESREGTSPCGYRSFLVEADAPWGVSPALQQQQQQRAPSSPTPQQGDSSPATMTLSGYRGLDSLLPQPTASQGWEPEGGGRACGPEGWGPALEFPGSPPWLSSCEAAAAAALDSQPQLKGGPEAAYQNLPRTPGVASCPAAPLVPGCQPFSSAPQGGTASSAPKDRGCLGLASPYKPFLAVLRSSLPATQQAGGEEARPDPAERRPGVGGQGGTGKDFRRDGKDTGRRAGGLVCP